MTINSDALYLDLETGKARVRKGAVWIPADRLLADSEAGVELKERIVDALCQCGLLEKGGVYEG